MSERRRVIGSEQIEEAFRKGRLTFEILPGDIVTALAKETAQGRGIKLLDGPLEKAAVARTDGGTALMRGLTRRSPKWVAPRSSAPRNIRRLNKIALIGAGGVGGNIGHLAANADMVDEIALIDIVPGLAESAALDLMHASGITRSKTKLYGGSDLALVKDADVIVVTAGKARSPGMTRADLISINRRVIQSAAEQIKTQAPNSIVIVVTNPLDEMTTEMLRATEFPRERVLGMAGTLDSSRFRNALAEAAGVYPADVEAVTIGSHGDEMVPITSLAKIKGRAVSAFLSQDVIDDCAHKAIHGGGAVVALKKTGSATIAPAHSSLELIDHIRGARVGSVPVSVELKGEYGIDGVVLGVPCHLGQSGLVEVEQLRLTEKEKTALHAAADAIRQRLAN